MGILPNAIWVVWLAISSENISLVKKKKNTLFEALVVLVRVSLPKQKEPKYFRILGDHLPRRPSSPWSQACMILNLGILKFQSGLNSYMARHIWALKYSSPPPICLVHKFGLRSWQIMQDWGIWYAYHFWYLHYSIWSGKKIIWEEFSYFDWVNQ